MRVDSQVLGGSPHVQGSRVLVRRLWSFYQRGTRVGTLLKQFPQLTPAQVFDALAFAFDNEEVMQADAASETEMLKRVGGRMPVRPAAPEQIELPFAANDRRPARRGGRKRR